MSSLLPIASPVSNAALPPVTQKAPAGFLPVAADGQATPANSFHSLLKQSSAALNNDSEPEASFADRAVKNGQASSALLATAAPVPLSAAENQPLPLKWSLNIFGNVPDPKTPASEQPVNADAQASTPHSPAAALVTPSVTPSLTSPVTLSAVPVATPKPQTLSPLPVPASKRQTPAPAAPQIQGPAPAPAPAPEPARAPAPAAAPVATSKAQSLPSAPAPENALPQVQETSAEGDTNATQQTQTAPAPQLIASTFAASPVTVSALPVAIPVAANDSTTSTASPALKGDRSRTLKQAATQTDNSSPAPVSPAPANPAITAPPSLTALTPAPAPANAAPAPAVKPESMPTPSVEPRAQQALERLVPPTEAAPKSVAPELAFALRVQPTSTPATSAPAETPTAPDLANAAATSAQPSAPATHETAQNTNQTQPPPSPIKSVSSAAAAPTVQSAQSSSGQNADPNTGSDPKGADSRRSDATLNAAPAASPAPASQVPQSVYPDAAASGPAAPAPAATPSRAPQTVATTASASLTPPPAAPKTGAASQISISVPAGDQQNVQVRLMDRAGEVHVTVRAPNEELAGSLRSDLSSLTGKLNQNGFSTEAFTPSSGSDSSRDQRSADPQQQSGAERQTPGRNPQQQSSQQNNRGNRPAWLDEFENSMAN